MTRIIRVLIPFDSHEEQAFTLALGYAEQIAKAAGVSDVILLNRIRGTD